MRLRLRVPRPLLSSHAEHKERCRRHELRDSAEHCLTIEALRARSWSSQKARADALRDAGVARLQCVMDHWPGARLSQDLPLDVAHIFQMGITRMELFWVLDDLISAKCFSWEQLNESRKITNKALPKRHVIPHLEKPTSESKK